MLREAIHKLCSEFHTAAPIDQEFSIFQEASSGPNRVELILDRVSSALDRRRDNTKSKVDQLEELLDGFAALVKDLRAELREKVETIARIEKDLEQAQLIGGVRAAQQDADELTQKIAIDRGIHVDALTNRLKTLVDSDRESDDLNPMRGFDFFFLQLSRQINTLKRRNSELLLRSHEMGVRPKLLEMCRQAVPGNCEAMTIGEMAEKPGEVAVAGGRVRIALNGLCATVSDEDEEFFAQKSAEELCSWATSFRKRRESEEIDRTDYTGRTIKPLAKSIPE
jgi:hypothetical protein